MEAELRQNNTPPADKMIPGDGRTLVVHFDKFGNVEFTETVPDGALAVPWRLSGFIWKTGMDSC